MNDKENRTGTDMVEDLAAFAYETDEFPTSEAAQRILAEDGTDTAQLLSWASEKLKGVKARQKLAAARERRLALEARLEALGKAITNTGSDIRRRVLSQIRVFGESDSEGAQVYCRKFEEMPDEDLADLEAELTMLDELQGEDGSQGKS